MFLRHIIRQPQSLHYNVVAQSTSSMNKSLVTFFLFLKPYSLKALKTHDHGRAIEKMRKIITYFTNYFCPVRILLFPIIYTYFTCAKNADQTFHIHMLDHLYTLTSLLR